MCRQHIETRRSCAAEAGIRDWGAELGEHVKVICRKISPSRFWNSLHEWGEAGFCVRWAFPSGVWRSVPVSWLVGIL